MALRLRILCKWNLILPGSGVSTGFTEGFYCEQDTLLKGTNLGYNLSLLRKPLFPAGAFLHAIEAKDVTNPGVSQSVPGELASSATYDTDVPWNCLLLGGRNASGNRHNIYVHSIPDIMVYQGGFAPSPTYTTKLNAYMTFLKGNGVQFRGRVLSAPLKTVGPAVANIDGTAVITAIGVIPFAVGDFVTCYRTKDNSGRAIKGRMQVKSVNTGDFTFTVYPWRGTSASQLFRMRLHAFDYYGNEIVNWQRVIIKKTGAPFGALVGRASNRT